MNKYLTNRFYVIVLALLCSILWGATFPLLKISYAEMHIAPDDIYAKTVLAALRFSLASILLIAFALIFIRISMKTLFIDKKLSLNLFLLGIFQTTLSIFFLYNGLANTSGIKGSILTSSVTFFLILFAHFIYKNDKIGLGKIIGLIAGFLGIYIVNISKGTLDLSFTFKGEGFLILYGIVTAAGNLMAKRISGSLHPVFLTGFQMLIGSIMLFALGLPGLKPQAMVFTAKAWIILIYFIIMTATTFTLWFSLLKYNKAGEIAIYNFVMPVVGAIIAVISLPGESFSVNLLGALILVSIGIIAINYQKKVLK